MLKAMKESMVKVTSVSYMGNFFKSMYSKIALFVSAAFLSYLIYLYFKNASNEKKLKKLRADISRLVEDNDMLKKLNNDNVKKALAIIKEHRKMEGENTKSADDANKASSNHNDIVNGFKSNDKGVVSDDVEEI